MYIKEWQNIFVLLNVKIHPWLFFLITTLYPIVNISCCASLDFPASQEEWVPQNMQMFWFDVFKVITVASESFSLMVARQKPAC